MDIDKERMRERGKGCRCLVETEGVGKKLKEE